MADNVVLSQSIIDFCYIFSLIISIIQIPFIILTIILFISNKKKSLMTSFSIQLTVAPLCNCISYLLPFQNPDQNLSVICKIQSVTHILSFLITVNMLFIYYLLNLLMFIKPSLAISKLISGLIYSINWIILITLGIFNYLQRPIKGKLNVCRYDTGAIIPTINTFYSGFIMFATIVVFVVIQINVCIRIKDSLEEREIEAYKMIRYYFVFIIFMVLVKVLSYFLKEGKGADAFYLIDRVWENLTSLLLMLTLVIGKKGFHDALDLYRQCCSKEDKQEVLTQLYPVSPGEEDLTEDSSVDY